MIDYNNIYGSLLKSLVESWMFDSEEDCKYSYRKYKSGVEFIITPECSKNCGICYLQKNRDKLYPDNLIDKDIILSNMREFLYYLKNKNKFIPMLNLFSGEIWGDKFGYDILNTLLEFSKHYRFTRFISIPTNMDFLFTDHGEEWMEYFIKEFGKIGVKINISASIDGAYLDTAFRPQDKNYSIKIDYNYNYYDKIFSFQSKHGFGFHPMVYSKNCKYWCDNYDWFIEVMNKYYPKYREPMMLEVRDNNWTDEDLEYYVKFLNHVVEHKLKLFNYSIPAFSQYVTRIRSYKIFSNSNIGAYEYSRKLNCTVTDNLFIRLGDMAICPCHRTCYPNNIYGYIVFNSDEMFVKPKNVELALKILNTYPNKDYPKCKECIYKDLCMKGCLGSQLENSGDIFEPCDSVCKMLKTKINFLVDKYTELGVYEALKQFPETKEYVNIVEEFKKKRLMSGDISDIK